MDEVLADILHTCLARIEAGVSVDACLAAYPQQRAALEAPLRAAVQLRALPRPALPATTRAALETRMLTLAAQRRAAPVSTASPNGRTHLPPRSSALGPAALAGVLRALGYQGPLRQPWLRLASAAIALVLALLLGAGALAAARAIVRVIIPPPTPAPTSAIPAAAPFSLDGPIEEIAPAGWVVNGISITLDPQTSISGVPVVGAVAHVRGVVQANSTLLARSIAIDMPSPASSAPLPAVTPVPGVLLTPTAVLPAVVPPSTPVVVHPPEQHDDGKDTCTGKDKDKDKDKKCKDKQKDKDKDEGDD